MGHIVRWSKDDLLGMSSWDVEACLKLICHLLFHNMQNEYPIYFP